jgi:hypothetical protein
LSGNRSPHERHFVAPLIIIRMIRHVPIFRARKKQQAAKLTLGCLLIV